MAETPQLLQGELPSDIGTLLVTTTATHLVALEFADLHKRMSDHLALRFGTYEVRTAEDPLGICSRLEAYLGGEFEALDDIEVDAFGTPFQREVWAALRRIPVGETMSYGQLAARLGQQGASRAVGMANSRNPIAIVVPCHRVIAADGKLSGYAGGVERKRWLLAHEQVKGQLGLRL